MYQFIADSVTPQLYQTPSTSTSGDGSFIMTFLLLELIALMFLGICLYKVFQKAGKPGWAGIVPIYNYWVLFGLTGLPSWTALLMLIPIINIIPSIIAFIAYYRLARLFGKDSGFGVLMVLLPVVGLAILAFGKAKFQNGNGQSYGAPHSETMPYATPPAADTDSPQPPTGPLANQ